MTNFFARFVISFLFILQASNAFAESRRIVFTFRDVDSNEQITNFRLTSHQNDVVEINDNIITLKQGSKVSRLNFDIHAEGYSYRTITIYLELFKEYSTPIAIYLARPWEYDENVSRGDINKSLYTHADRKAESLRRLYNVIQENNLNYYALKFALADSYIENTYHPRVFQCYEAQQLFGGQTGPQKKRTRKYMSKKKEIEIDCNQFSTQADSYLNDWLNSI